jgi:signal transduction histidine kinase/DNA-binding response OmpR family regulator
MLHKILLVDDEASIVELLEKMLTRENLQIYKAYDGKTAFEIILVEKPDVVIADLIMPGMGGWELFEQTRKVNPDTTFIFLTGYGNIPDAINSIKKGVFDYLEKPLSVQKIRRVLNAALEYHDTMLENKYLKHRLSSLMDRSIDLDELLKHCPRIRDISDFSTNLNQDDSERDLFKKLLTAALEITQSTKGSIFLHHAKEKEFSLDLTGSSLEEPCVDVQNEPVNHSHGILSQNKLFSHNSFLSTATAEINKFPQQDDKDSQQSMTLPIEDAYEDWGVLYLNGKISGEEYNLEDFVNASLLIRKVVDKLSKLYFIHQRKIFKENADALRKTCKSLQHYNTHLTGPPATFMVVIDGQAKILDACEGYKDILSRNDHILSEYLFDEPLWGQLGEGNQSKLREAIEKNEMFLSDEPISIQTPHNLHFFKIRMLPIPNKQKEHPLKIYLIILEDITVQENIQKRLFTLETLSVAGMFVASITHDLNNPLDGLNRLVKIIENRLGDKIEHQYFQLIYSTIKRMATSIRSFSECTRRAAAKTTSVRLREILDETSCIMSPKLSEKNIRIRKTYRSQHSDKNVSAEIYSVFINLIRNAFDAVDDNGLIEIEILDNPDQKHVDVVFKDDGAGISETIIDDVMKPFFTTKEHGMGLGLTLCNKTVRECGGKIDIKNREKKGCKVTVSLPVK